MRLIVWAVVSAGLLSSTILIDASHAAEPYSVTSPGKPVKVAWFSELFPNCQSKGFATISVTAPPSNGVAKYVHGRDYTNFPSTNTYASCNRQKVPATVVYYYPNSGFVGTDRFALEYVDPTGAAGVRYYRVDVR